MNKKTILGLLTGAAIVAATTGSYAAWDKLTDTATTTVAIASPVTITAQNVTAPTANDSLTDSNGNLIYTADLPFKVDTSGRENLKLTVPTTVKVADTELDSSKVSTELQDATGAPVTDDSVITNQEYKVHVTVTLGENDRNLAGQNLSIESTATLSPKSE